MATYVIPPPPTQNNDFNGVVWQQWFNQLRNLGLTVVDHNQLLNLQGGGASERYHLTLAQRSAVQTIPTVTTAANYQFTYDKYIPIEGSTVTFNNNKKTLLLTPTGALNAITINLPSAPFDGQEIRITTTQTISAITLTPAIGHTVSVSPVALGNLWLSASFIFVASSNTWYKL